MHAATVGPMLACVTVVGRGHRATRMQRQDRWFGPHGPRKSCAHTGIIYEARRGGCVSVWALLLNGLSFLNRSKASEACRGSVLVD